jgi:F0F1-type ATP synthase assembly protein I
MPKRDDQDYGRAWGLGLQVLVGAGLGLLVGMWIDRKFQTRPWGLLIGLFIGLAAGMYQLIREGMRINK